MTGYEHTRLNIYNQSSRIKTLFSVGEFESSVKLDHVDCRLSLKCCFVFSTFGPDPL